MKPYILYQLLEQLIATPYCTASSLAKQLVPSEKTVRTDLKHTEPLFSDFALSLMRKPGCGIILSGSRKNMMRLQSYLQEEKAHCFACRFNETRQLYSAIFYTACCAFHIHYACSSWKRYCTSPKARCMQIYERRVVAADISSVHPAYFKRHTDNRGGKRKR